MENQVPAMSWEKLVERSTDVKIYNNVDAFEEVPQLFSYPDEYFDNVESVEGMMNASFVSNASIPAPTNLYTHHDSSKDPLLDVPKEQFREVFEHSASSSFFAYLPIEFWYQVLTETNLYLAQNDSKAAGCNKVKPLVLDELMTFLGILFYMELNSKGEYANYWGSQLETRLFNALNDSADFVNYGLDSVMKKKRFEQFRASLSFHANVSEDMLETDPLARIRPLIRAFNTNCGKYVIPGRNVTVDESSIACRSKFGRGLIVYNPTKPGGKYHFRLYVMTTGSSYIILNTIVH